MSLFDGILDQYDTPAPEPVIPAAVITIKRASTGQEILLCSATPPPASAKNEASSRKLALFTFDEIPTMRQIPAVMLEKIIHSRAVFGWGGAV